MNQQLIDNLLHKAGAYFGAEGTDYSGFSSSKFAELIVKECMNQVREQYLPVLEDEDMMKDIHWVYYVDCGVDSYVAIREHFGVE